MTLVRVLLLCFMIISGLFYFEYKKISHNANSELNYGFEVGKINEILIGYQFNKKNKDDFKSFLSYFWQSGYYSHLYFVYEKDGSALFSNPNEDPDKSPIDMRTRPWYKAGKLNGERGVIGPYKGHFPPHEEVFFFYYPVYVNNQLVGVGDYDLQVEKIMESTIGLLSIKKLHLDEDDRLIISFYLSFSNSVNLLVAFILFFILSSGLIKIHTHILVVLSGAKLCSLSGLKRRDSFKANKLDQRVKALCFLDIDHFKSINDTYGHDIGDDAIKAFANCLKENIRDTDVVFRWGGEEFLVIIRGKVDENIDVYNILERLRASVEAMDIDGVPKFTVSIGYCHYDSNVDVKELIKQSDLALYESKRAGRNKVSEYKSRMSDEPITA